MTEQSRWRWQVALLTARCVENWTTEVDNWNRIYDAARLADQALPVKEHVPNLEELTTVNETEEAIRLLTEELCRVKEELGRLREVASQRPGNPGAQRGKPPA